MSDTSKSTNSGNSAGYFRDANLSFAGDDYSNPSASSSVSSKYKTGDFYNVSGGSAGFGLGKIIVFGVLGLIGYAIYKKAKK